MEKELVFRGTKDDPQLSQELMKCMRVMVSRDPDQMAALEREFAEQLEACSAERRSELETFIDSLAKVRRHLQGEERTPLPEPDYAELLPRGQRDTSKTGLEEELDFKKFVLAELERMDKSWDELVKSEDRERLATVMQSTKENIERVRAEIQTIEAEIFRAGKENIKK